MRKPIIAGNWKMHNTIAAAKELVSALLETTDAVTGVEKVVAPPYTALTIVKKLIAGTSFKLAAQNMHYEEKGAFTGEIAPAMLEEIGCDYVIIGHSERRAYYNETNKTVNGKIFTALNHGLAPIVCIGESEKQRETGVTAAVITEQVTDCFANLSAEQMSRLVVAYEPLWAIGTGKTATPEQAQEVHQLIRKLLSENFNPQTAELVRIQYGGSVKPENTAILMSQPDIDGALVGGASLKAESFSEIIKISALS